jgi:A/G-specific adenine glycosylase
MLLYGGDFNFCHTYGKVVMNDRNTARHMISTTITIPEPQATETFSALLAKMAAPLEVWYLQHARSLPWRDTQDAYAIWVSEIMLQQTQVATVIPYYHRFLKRFPTVEALATADIDDVTKLWEGLGYYTRCRNLHKAASVVVREYGGKVPDDYEQILALPGVGKYTAGAILSFAYHQRVPLLDGNVKRILARLMNDDAPINAPATEAKHWQWITQLLNTCNSPYHFNQAIMELGATVCTPKLTKCLLCPLHLMCGAYQNGKVAMLPVKLPSKKVPHKHIGVALIQNAEGRYFVQQRPETGLLPGLWEFPGGKQEEGEAIEATVVREISEELGFEVETTQHALNVDHAYSHFKVTLHVFHTHLNTQVNTPPKLAAAQAFKWATLTEMRELAFPKANHHILNYLEGVVNHEAGFPA